MNETTFNVNLPRTDAEGDSSSTTISPTRILSGRETILFVEEHDGLRQFVHKVLSRHGYDVHAVADPTEAANFAESHPTTIHLVLTELVLPGMSGPAMVASLREHHPESKVLVVQKPFTASALVRRVRDVLDS
jgi:DNA-binding NtrC family response regulator